MLSKALQKANTAVLLDNAANFEGAIEAYQDACQLLQLVMVRSSGTDDEKSKLQEIVSCLLFCNPLLPRFPVLIYLL
jgi:chromosome condensin MukBEF MukE localization factor